jgi:hypothetical protein
VGGGGGGVRDGGEGWEVAHMPRWAVGAACIRCTPYGHTHTHTHTCTLTLTHSHTARPPCAGLANTGATDPYKEYLLAAGFDV